MRDCRILYIYTVFAAVNPVFLEALAQVQTLSAPAARRVAATVAESCALIANRYESGAKAQEAREVPFGARIGAVILAKFALREGDGDSGWCESAASPCQIACMLTSASSISFKHLHRAGNVSRASPGLQVSTDRERTRNLLQRVHHAHREGAMKAIHDVAPREIDGRETILRFRMQFQAAAFAALEILRGADIDRVYCDYHDDFVVRRTVEGRQDYHFFQVKTKAKLNRLFGLNEVFSLKKKKQGDDKDSLGAIRDSIAGKLFVHTLEFGDACREVTILSNVHFEDDVEDVVKGFRVDATSTKHVEFFLSRFCDIFQLSPVLTPDQVKALTRKLSLVPGASHIGETLEAFTNASRTAIYNHSEIDLRPHEIDEIAKSLVSLVMTKSCARIPGVKRLDLESLTGIGLEDILGVLSISTEVYKNLLAGEDPSAIKTASILQRQLTEAGAGEQMIELISRLKVKWDIWLRSARHVHTELDLQTLLDRIDTVCVNWLKSGGLIADLRGHISALTAQIDMARFPNLDEELLFGGVNAAMVRRATR